MSRPETPVPSVPDPARYGRWVAVLAIVIVLLITLNTLLTKPNGSSGVAAGTQIPPFAVPLALGQLEGAADVSPGGHEGERGNVPACKERQKGALNVCALYEGHPLVLALFIDKGSCPDVLSDLQALRPSFPQVNFAAVAIHGSRSSVKQLIASRGLTFPVGYDLYGAIAPLYKVATCPQLTFVLPGGRAYGKAILSRPSAATLRARVTALAKAATRRRGAA